MSTDSPNCVQLIINGHRYVECDWPADGRYEITTHIAHPVHLPGRPSYMGLFKRESVQSEIAPTIASPGGETPAACSRQADAPYDKRETPRTDELEKAVEIYEEAGSYLHHRYRHLSRQLERELNAERSEVEFSHNEIAYLREALDAERSAKVPTGWCAVPIEPTQRMLDAGNASDYAAATHRPAGLIWRSMIKAISSSDSVSDDAG